MKKIVALVAVLFSVVVPVQAQANDKALVIIDSYFQSNIATGAITSTGAACPQSKTVVNTIPSSPYNHGTQMYAVAKLQNPNIKIIPICGANQTTEMNPAMFISSLKWVENNAGQVAAVSFSRYFNHATKPCTPTASAPWTPATANTEILRLINSLKSKGILIFASTGNVIGKPVNYPACLTEMASVVHANELNQPLGNSDANTKYFVKLSNDGSKFNYNTSIGLVAHTSSSSTAALAAMWITNKVPFGVAIPTA